MNGPAKINFSHPLASGLVCYLRFNEGAGTNIANSITPSQPGTATSANWTTIDGQTAYDFNAVNGRKITVPDHSAIDVGTTFTISARVTIPAAAPVAGQNVCTKGNTGNAAYEIDVSNANLLRTNAAHSAVIASTAFSYVATTRHIAVSCLTNTESLYVDGAFAVSGSGTLGNSSDSLFLGSDTTDASKTLTGAMSEFILWNRDLSAAEILQLYTDPGAMFYRRFLLVR